MVHPAVCPLLLEAGRGSFEADRSIPQGGLNVIWFGWGTGLLSIRARSLRRRQAEIVLSVQE